MGHGGSGVLGKFVFLGKSTTSGGSSGGADAGGVRSGSDSVSSWNRVGSGERSGSTDSQGRSGSADSRERSGSADSRGALTLGGALESWAEPAGVL